MIKKIKYWFWRFYLRPFFSFFMSFWILIYINSREQTHFMNQAGLLIFMVIGFSGLLGTANLFLDKFFLPSEFEKLVEKKPFRSFIKNGFCVANGYLNGTVNGYQILLGYQIGKERIVRKLFVNIIFNPKKEGIFMAEEGLNELNNKYKNDSVEWSINSLDIEFRFESYPPHFSFLLEEIKHGISILKEEGFKPSTLADSYNVEKEIWQELLIQTT